MKISYNWLQSHFDAPLPSPEDVAEKLIFHAFEVEGIEREGEDSVLDISVLPNRAHDCLCHLGIARELSVLLDMPLKRDVLREEKKELPESKKLTLAIDDTVNAPRHTAALVTGITVKESPEWLKTYLESVGQRSINNIVDATNYVMLSLGQPTHAFDADKLTEKDGMIGITIRSAKAGEKLTLLGGAEATELSEGMLVLADSHSGAVLDIAGTKGGTQAELTEGTTSVVLSAANFKGSSIRKTSQALKLRTDASTRFENGISPELPYYGLTELVALVLELAGGELEGCSDIYPRPQKNSYKTGVSVDEVNRLLGTEITGKDIENIFSRFGFPYEKAKPADAAIQIGKKHVGAKYQYAASVLFDAPALFDCSSFVAYAFSRAGISLPRMAVDQYVYGTKISEGDARPGDIVFGKNGTPSKPLTFVMRSDNSEVTHNGPTKETQEFMPGTPVEEGVSHCGIYLGDGRVLHASHEKGELLEESLEESAHFKNIVGYRRVTDNSERYVVEIPFERIDLRTKEDLIEEIGRVYGYGNIKADAPKAGEFEVNKKYYCEERVRNILTNAGFTEIYTYSLRDNGEVEIENPLASDKGFMRANLSDGVRQSIMLNEKNLPLLGIESVKVFEIGNVFKKDREYTSICIGGPQTAVETALAALRDVFGELGGEFNNGVYEFDLDALIGALPEPELYDVAPDSKPISYRSFSVYPFALRDIAVWVPESVDSDDVRAIIEEAAGTSLVRSTLFDEFKKDGRVSYAFRLVFQSPEKTLSEEDLSSAMKRITAALGDREGFEVR